LSSSSSKASADEFERVYGTRPTVAGYSDLWFSLRFSQCKGPIATLEEAKILARSAALLAGVGQLDAAKRAFHMIASQDLALDAMNDVIRDHFDRPGLKLD
jgi:hypothetical protein